MTIKIRNLAIAPPLKPHDEKLRQEELESLNILDTAIEQRFDQYTKLAATILDVPVALISFVDKDRQWFKSAHGLDITETPREVSFCAHALAEDEILVVPDAQLDPRFVGNPLVDNDPGIRFYAGAVIRGPNGHALGTCCAIDHKERVLSDRERAALIQIARMIEGEMQASGLAADATGTRWHRGSVDPTTGLPDMALFGRRLVDELETARLGNEQRVLAMIRVDRFDALEAAIGRQASKYLVGQLAQSIEGTAFPDCLIGQAREDKLCVLLPLSSDQTPAATLDLLLQAIPQSMTLAEHTVSIRASVGASVFPSHARTAEKLVRRARTALWSKPISSHSGYNLYRRRQSDAASRYFRLQSAMKVAFERDEFSLVFQPKLDVQGRQLMGAEALLRWRSDTLGDVSPVEFIPVAEKTGLIVDLGYWVLNTACKQLNTWADAGFDCPELAVNIASQQLRQPDFLEAVKILLSEHRLSKGQLNLELTESSLVEDIAGAVRAMRRLNRLGVSFSIDDFGTGFSSLSYLRSMPIKVLKIDRSFVKNVPESQDDRKLVRSIVSMAHDLDMIVVAEGVESDRQLSFLRSIGCDQVQGFVFSRPLPAQDFRAFAAGISRETGQRTVDTVACMNAQ